MREEGGEGDRRDEAYRAVQAVLSEIDAHHPRGRDPQSPLAGDAAWMGCDVPSRQHGCHRGPCTPRRQDPMSDDVKPDGYNTPVPAKILTPDRVETRIGTLEFADGFPTEATAQLLYDHLDFLRGVEAFLSGVPAASLEAMRDRDGGGRGHGLPPGRHPRPAAGLGPAVPDRQHRHRVRVGHPRPRARRPHRRRDPARLRPDHGQRRLVPVHHRHGPAGPGPWPGRQVPDRARRATTGRSPTGTSCRSRRHGSTG